MNPTIDRDRLRIGQRTRAMGFPKRHVEAIEYQTREITAKQLAAWYDLWPAIKRGATSYFYGRRGVGKTALMSAIGFKWMECIDHGVATYRGSPRYWTARDLFDQQLAWMDSTKDREAPIALAERAGLLVIDEIGEARFTAYQTTELSAIVDKRYGNALPTVLVSNQTPQAICGLGLSPSVIDRVKDGGVFLDASDWENMREASG
jgi:DNA replication protein DnaC